MVLVNSQRLFCGRDFGLGFADRGEPKEEMAGRR